MNNSFSLRSRKLKMVQLKLLKILILNRCPMEPMKITQKPMHQFNIVNFF